MKQINKDLLWAAINNHFTNPDFHHSDYLTMAYQECLDILNNGLMQKPLASNYDDANNYKADMMRYNLKSKFHKFLIDNNFID